MSDDETVLTTAKEVLVLMDEANIYGFSDVGAAVVMYLLGRETADQTVKNLKSLASDYLED